jgi:hypothetical protein
LASAVRLVIARFPFAGSLALLALLGLADSAAAYQVAIAAGSRALFLQVGTGTMTGGNYSSGGTPANNATINVVSVTLSAANLGTGPVTMSSNSAVANSPYDSFAFCSPPNQVYVGGFFRRNGGGPNSNATLSVATPAALLNASSDTIPFSAVSWISGGAGDATPTIPSGTFTGATQTLLTFARNNWFESCLTFRFSNAQAYPAGTFTGRATYTLSAP